MKHQYYIIRPETGDELKGCSSAFGPFATVAEAREHIRQDAAECYLNCDKSLRETPTEEWGEKNYIVQVVSIVRPCPKAEISVRLTSVPIS